MEQSFTVTIISGTGGVEDVKVSGPVTLPVAEMALTSALAAVKRELLALRLGKAPTPGAIVLSPRMPGDGPRR